MAVAPSNQEVSSGKGAVKSTRQLKKEQEQMGRLWAEKWWPLAFSAHTSKLAPQSVWLLGVPLVLWWDPVAAAWRCTRDQCSHRLAPLSEGRIQTDTGCIECPYHGWTFDGAGACSKIPQLDESVKIDQRRARVLALPTLERQGLVWVWAGALSGCGAEEPRGEPATVAALDADGVAVTDYSRDLWMDATTLCENVLDPAHLPFTHHETISNRRAARPVSFRLRGPISREGFSADRGSAAEKAEAAETADTAETAEAARSTGAAGAVSFVAPLLVLSETHRPDAFSDYNVVYAVPTRPGRCRILVRICFEVSAMRPPLKWIIGLSFTRLPKWLLHLSNHAVLEDDNIFLHAQGHAYRGSVKEREGAQLVPEWRQRLHMPATADSIVIAFRRWLDDYTAGRGVAWSPMLPADLETSANVRASKETLLERGDSHVQHCSCCHGALAFARRGRTASDVLLPLALLLTALSGNRVAARAGLVAAAAAAVASRACTAMQHKLLVGDYPPPRNERK